MNSLHLPPGHLISARSCSQIQHKKEHIPHGIFPITEDDAGFSHKILGTVNIELIRFILEVELIDKPCDFLLVIIPQGLCHDNDTDHGKGRIINKDTKRKKIAIHAEITPEKDQIVRFALGFFNGKAFYFLVSNEFLEAFCSLIHGVTSFFRISLIILHREEKWKVQGDFI